MTLLISIERNIVNMLRIPKPEHPSLNIPALSHYSCQLDLQCVGFPPQDSSENNEPVQMNVAHYQKVVILDCDHVMLLHILCEIF